MLTWVNHGFENDLYQFIATQNRIFDCLVKVSVHTRNIKQAVIIDAANTTPDDSRQTT